MKQGELTRANMDFEQRLADLRQAAESGDIHAMLVVSGVIAISN
jgi:muramoyltetrapeptide carboxypeptidase LdcA involved in peptidoglycan recycling